MVFKENSSPTKGKIPTKGVGGSPLKTYAVVSGSNFKPLSIVLKRTPLKDLDQMSSEDQTKEKESLRKRKKSADDGKDESQCKRSRNGSSPPSPDHDNKDFMTPARRRRLLFEKENVVVVKKLDLKELNGKYWSDLADLPPKRSRTPRKTIETDDEEQETKSQKKTRSRRTSLATPVAAIRSPALSKMKTLRRTQSEVKRKISPLSPISEAQTPTRRRVRQKTEDTPTRRGSAAKKGPVRKLLAESDDDFASPKKKRNKKADTPTRRGSPAAKKGPVRKLSAESDDDFASPKKKRNKKTDTPTRRGSPAAKKGPVRKLSAEIENSDEDFVTPKKKKDKKINKAKIIDLLEDDEVDEYEPSKKESSSSEEEEDSDYEEEEEKVVKKPKQKKTKTRVIVPKTPLRKVPLSNRVSSIQEAQLKLHVSAVPDSLPCREDEFAEIYAFTAGKIAEGSGGCMYISGVPGTGKTATVKEVIRVLQSDSGVPDFIFIEINGMRLTEPRQAYVQIWKGLHGPGKVTAEHAAELLDRKFNSSSNKSKPIVLLVDELDMLCRTRKQSVLYNIFEWPNRPSGKLIVLAIANTMDLPERAMLNRVSSRMGLTRLTFSPYSHHQLQQIVATRLEGLEDIFDQDAVQLVSRKVASLSGDARRALDICRRATEIAERDDCKLVGLEHVTEAHNEMFCSPKITAIRCCSKYEKLFLNTIVSEFQRTGIEETSFQRVISSLQVSAHFEGLRKLSVSEVYALCNRLSGCRLILADPGSKGLELRIRLNVSVDDVLFALKPLKK